MAWKMPSILEENAKLTTLRYKNRRGACQKNLEKLTIRVTNRPSATSHPPMTFWQRSSPAHSLKRPPNKPLVPHQLRKPNLNFPSPQKPTPGKYLYPPRYSPFPHLQKPGAPPPLPPPGDNHIPQLPLLRETSLERAIVFAHRVLYSEWRPIPRFRFVNKDFSQGAMKRLYSTSDRSSTLRSVSTATQSAARNVS